MRIRILIFIAITFLNLCQIMGAGNADEKQDPKIAENILIKNSAIKKSDNSKSGKSYAVLEVSEHPIVNNYTDNIKFKTDFRKINISFENKKYSKNIQNDKENIKEIKYAVRNNILQDRIVYYQKKMQKELAVKKLENYADMRVKLNGPDNARKIKRLPLASKKSDHGAVKNRDVSRHIEMEKIYNQIDNAKGNPIETDRLKLRLAAAHVGSGDKEKAISIYAEIAENPSHPGFRTIALKNLKILGFTKSGYRKKSEEDVNISTVSGHYGKGGKEQ